MVGHVLASTGNVLTGGRVDCPRVLLPGHVHIAHVLLEVAARVVRNVLSIVALRVVAAGEDEPLGDARLTLLTLVLSSADKAHLVEGGGGKECEEFKINYYVKWTFTRSHSVSLKSAGRTYQSYGHDHLELHICCLWFLQLHYLAHTR